MTQSISVVYVPVPVELGITVHAYHMAIVYDKGDGTAPKVIEAKPLVPYSGTQAQKDEVPRELNELYNPAVTGPGADRNSPYGRLNADESDRDSSFDRYDSKVVITGDNLGSKWDAIQGTIGFVNDGNFAYLPLIQNSNTFAAFALQRAGLQVPDTSFFVGGTDQTSNMYVPAMGKPLSIHQNPNASSLEDVSGTVVGELDGSITILALANDPNQAGVIKVSANINSKDQTTEVETSSSDGTSTRTVFDTGTEPWSSETSAFDAYQRLQSQRVEFDGGGQQVKQYDPNNTHPYTELDVTKGTDGQVSAAQAQLDQNIIAAGGSVGQIFGSALGRALAPNNQFAQLAIGTVAGLIGQKLLQTFTASLTLDASKFVAGDFASVTGLDVAHAGIGAISSFLTAELGRELHLTGFGAELFNGAVGGVTGSVLNQVVDKIATGVSFDAAIGLINWSTAATQAGYNISAAAGTFLAHAFVPVESQEGAVGGQLLGAVGSALGLAAVVNAALTGILSFIIPGLGSFFGTIVGTMLGDAIAGDPANPKAAHDVEILGSDTHFQNRLVGTDDHGNAAVSQQMGDQVTAIANSYLDAVHGAGIAYSGKVMIGYNSGAAPYQYITGWFPNGTEVTPHFANATDAIQEGVRELLVNTEVIGGDLLVKRAHQAFINGPHPVPTEISPDFSDLISLSGDLSVAQDYENYLNNREAINALMAVNVSMAGSRNSCRRALFA